jgi:hypothetical protein
MCGVKITLSSPCSSEQNGSAALWGSVAKCRVIDDETPAQVEEDAAWSHPREVLVTEEIAVLGSSIHVQRHDIYGLEQLCEGSTRPCVTKRELVGHVVEEDRHPEALGDHRQLAADVAVADDAEPPASDLVTPRG